MNTSDFKKNREGLRKIKELTEKIAQPVVHSEEEYNKRIQNLSRKLEEKQSEVLRLTEELERVGSDYDALKRAYANLINTIIKRKKDKNKK